MKQQFLPMLENIEPIQNFVREQALLQGFKKTDKVELAIEEVVTNIIHYSQSKLIEIHCSKASLPGIQVIVRDEGISYNPLNHVKTYSEIQKMPYEDGKSGGYGIYLFCKLMDHVEYRREDGSNILILTKYL